MEGNEYVPRKRGDSYVVQGLASLAAAPAVWSGCPRVAGQLRAGLQPPSFFKILDPPISKGTVLR